MKKILIVDDDPDIRELLTVVLEMADYAIITAENGKIALDILEQGSIDLIVLDMMMPVMSGLQFLEVYSENHKYSDIPVVVNSAYPARDFENQVFLLGAKYYFRKGYYSIDEFLDKIAVILAVSAN